MEAVYSRTLKKKNTENDAYFDLKKKKVAEMMFAGSLAVQKQKLFIML